jgi:hypothetical protein
MSHPYDAGTKYLVQTRLADWLPLCGLTTTAEIQVIDADLATVTAAADRVLRVCENPPWLMHLELQASRDDDLLPNLPVYIVEGVHGMKESVTYQANVEEGLVRARQEDLLQLGRERFGAPSTAIDTALRDIADPDHLARMIRTLLHVSSWEELLATP